MTQPRRSILVLSVALLACAVVALGRGGHRHPTRAGSHRVRSASGGAAPAPRVLWARGQEIRYTLSWRSRSQVHLGSDQAAAAAVDVSGQLALRGLGERDGLQRVGISLRALERHRLSALGRDLLADPAAARELLLGREALVEIDGRGTVQAVRFRPSDPTLWKNLMLGLLGELSMSLPADPSPSWQVRETGPSGLAEARYQWDDGRIERRRLRYETLTVLGDRPCADCTQSLASAGAIELDPRGLVHRILDDETLRVVGASAGELAATETHLDLRLAAIAAFDPPDEVADGDLELSHLGQPIEGARLEAELLASRVGGLKVPELLAEIDRYGAGSGSLPRGFISRASGLLIQHPELCARLARTASRADASTRTRALLLDLLASAAHPQAQAAMREVLESAAVRTDPAYPTLLERLAFLPRPERASTELVQKRLQAAQAAGEPELARAAAHTLGALAGALTRSGEGELGHELHAQLASLLGQARTTEDKQALLAALGNANLPEGVDTLVGYAHADEPALRAQAALALRASEADVARQALLRSASDADAGVESAALAALSTRRLAPGELGSVGAAVTANATSPELDGDFVTLLARNARSAEDVAAPLEHIAARTSNPRLRGRTHFVLEQLRALAAR
jgi:hypothetical protein